MPQVLRIVVGGTPDPAKAPAARKRKPIDTQPPSPSPWDCLPVELQIEIVSHLAIPSTVPLGSVSPDEVDKVIGHPADFAPVYKAHINGLAGLCSLSSTLCEIARPLLYENIWVWHTRSVVQLLLTLLENKKLRGMIKHFAVSVPPGYLNEQVDEQIVGKKFKQMFSGYKSFDLTRAERQLEFATNSRVRCNNSTPHSARWRTVRLNDPAFWNMTGLAPREVPNVAAALIALLSPNIETLSFALQEIGVFAEFKHEKEYQQLTYAAEKALNRGHLVLQKLKILRVRSANYKVTVHGPMPQILGRLPSLNTIEYVGDDDWYAWLDAHPVAENIEVARLHLSAADAVDIRSCLMKWPNLKIFKADFVAGAHGPKAWLGQCFLPTCVDEKGQLVKACQELEILDLRWDTTDWEDIERSLPPCGKKLTRCGGRTPFAAPPPVRPLGSSQMLARAHTREARVLFQPDTSRMQFNLLPKLKHLTIDLHALFGGRYRWLSSYSPLGTVAVQTVTPLLPSTLQTLHVIENWMPTHLEGIERYYQAERDRPRYRETLMENLFGDLLKHTPGDLRRLTFTPDHESVVEGIIVQDFPLLTASFESIGIEFVVKYVEQLQDSVTVYPGTEHEYTVRHWKWNEEDQIDHLSLDPLEDSGVAFEELHLDDTRVAI